MKIQNKQDVIRWLKRLREDHPLSVATAVRQHYTDQDALVRVYTDQIIKDRYTGMIEYLESMELYRLIENGEIYTEQEKNECIEESEGEYSEKDFIENEYWETDGEVA